MARKLKVFQARFGFYDTVIAAPSQAAALRAWGAHQNLFTDGQASLATDAAAIEAALAHLEVALRRGIGTDDPFSLHPRLPQLPDLPDLPSRPSPPKASAKPALKVVPKAVPRPDPPSRAALDAAEAAVTELDAARRREEADLQRRRAELDAEERTAQGRYDTALAKLRKAVEHERDAFGRAKQRYDRG